MEKTSIRKKLLAIVSIYKVDGRGQEWMGVGGSGWEWMGDGGSGWEWMGVDGVR